MAVSPFTSNYGSVLVAPPTSIEITMVYPDRPPFKINLADSQGYCGNMFEKISDRRRDILVYSREVNRD